ncbi:hypothetical protein IWQ60_009536 [Tieghemiomyces parasiticus]|uniref:Uncharacterized protein n=1 Tax=Tieghemiomyces parasiticus TaxID=78921 RepID=A0A9W7ZTF1_9FUNG|nr:hypothetical protein IWQ60_009536 [Tieghemiomyces parasiticus]
MSKATSAAAAKAKRSKAAQDREYLAHAVLLETRDMHGMQRNDHEEWIIRHLYQPVCPATFKDQDIRILNVDPRNGFNWQQTLRSTGPVVPGTARPSFLHRRFRFTKKTTFYTVRPRYKIAFIIDGSPSMFTVDTQGRDMLIRQAFRVFKRCLKGLLQAPPWDAPTIYVRFAVTCLSSNQSFGDGHLDPDLPPALLHDLTTMELRPDTIHHILQSARETLDARASTLVHDDPFPVPPAAAPRFDSHINFALDVADYQLGLMPDDCAPVFVFISDSVIRSNTGLDQLGNLTSSLNRLDTKCLFVQVGSGQGSNVQANFGYLPDNKASRFLASTLDGSFLYGDDCHDLPWSALPRTDPPVGSPRVTNDAPLAADVPNLYHQCILIKETQLVPPGGTLSLYNLANRGEPRFLDEPREKTNKLINRHFDVSRWFDKFPWNPHSLPPMVDLTRTRWREYMLSVPLQMIIEGRLKEGFCLRNVIHRAVAVDQKDRELFISLEMIYYPNVVIQYQISPSPLPLAPTAAGGGAYRQYTINIDIKSFNTFSIVLARVNDADDFHSQALRVKLASLERFLERVAKRDSMLRTLSGIRPYYLTAAHPSATPATKARPQPSKATPSAAVTDVPDHDQVLTLLQAHWDTDWDQMAYSAKRRFNFAVGFVPEGCRGDGPFPDPAALARRAHAKLTEFQRYVISSWKGNSLGDRSFVSFWPDKHSREQPSVNFCVHEWIFGGNWVVYVDIFFYNLSLAGRRQITADFAHRVRQFRGQPGRDTIVLLKRPLSFSPRSLDHLKVAYPPRYLAMHRVTAQASGAWRYRVWSVQWVALETGDDRQSTDEKGADEGTAINPELTPGALTARRVESAADPTRDHLMAMYRRAYAGGLGGGRLLIYHTDHELTLFQDGDATQGMREITTTCDVTARHLCEREWAEPFLTDPAVPVGDEDNETGSAQDRALAALVHEELGAPEPLTYRLQAAYATYYGLATPGFAFRYGSGYSATQTEPPGGVVRQFCHLTALLPRNGFYVLHTNPQPSAHGDFVGAMSHLPAEPAPDPALASPPMLAAVVLEAAELRAYASAGGDAAPPLPATTQAKLAALRIPLLHAYRDARYQVGAFGTYFRSWAAVTDPDAFLFTSARGFLEQALLADADALIAVPHDPSFDAHVSGVLAELMRVAPSEQRLSFHRLVLTPAHTAGPRRERLWFVRRLEGTDTVLLTAWDGVTCHATARPVAHSATPTPSTPSTSSRTSSGLGLADMFGEETVETTGDPPVDKDDNAGDKPAPQQVGTPYPMGDGRRATVLVQPDPMAADVTYDPTSPLASCRLLVVEARAENLAVEGLLRYHRRAPVLEVRPRHDEADETAGTNRTPSWSVHVRGGLPSAASDTRAANTPPPATLNHLRHLAELQRFANARAVYGALLAGHPVPDGAVANILPQFRTFSIDLDLTPFLKTQLPLLSAVGAGNPYHAGLQAEFRAALHANFSPLDLPDHPHYFLYRPPRAVYTNVGSPSAPTSSSRTSSPAPPPHPEEINEAFRAFLDCAQAPLFLTLACTYRRRTPATRGTETWTVPMVDLPTSFTFTDAETGRLVDLTPSDSAASFEPSPPTDVRVTLHVRCLVLGHTEPANPPPPSTLALRRPLASANRLARFRCALDRHLPAGHGTDLATILMTAQQLMNRAVLHGLAYASPLTAPMLHLAEAHVRQRRAWDPAGSESVREYGLGFVRPDRDRMTLFMAELLKADISPYRFVERGKIVYVTKDDDPLDGDNVPRTAPRPFWLLLTFNRRALTVLAYGPSAQADLAAAAQVLQPAFKSVNFLTNQLLLLRHLGSTRRADHLLLPDAAAVAAAKAEAGAGSGMGSSADLATAHRPSGISITSSPSHASASYGGLPSAASTSSTDSETTPNDGIDDDEEGPSPTSDSNSGDRTGAMPCGTGGSGNDNDDDAFSPFDPNEPGSSQAERPVFLDLGPHRAYRAGEFACPRLCERHFDLHPRLSPGAALKVLRVRYSSLQVRGRDNVFLITQRDPVYYARIEERDCEPEEAGTDGSPPPGPLRSPGGLSIGSDPTTLGLARRHSDTAYLRFGHTNDVGGPRPRPRRLMIEVFGARADTDPRIDEFLRDVGECLEHKVALPALRQYLSASGDVTREDVHFLLYARLVTARRYLFNVHPAVSEPFLLLRYVRQHLLHYLRPLSGPCLRSVLAAHHRQVGEPSVLDDTPGARPSHIPLEDFVFVYNGTTSSAPGATRLRLGSGMITIHTALLDADGRLRGETPPGPVAVPTPSSLAWYRKAAEFHAFQRLDAVGPAFPLGSAVVAFDAWTAGNVDAEAVQTNLLRIYRQAAGAYLVEMGLRIDAPLPVLMGPIGREVLAHLARDAPQAFPFGRADPDFPLAPGPASDTLAEVARTVFSSEPNVRVRAFQGPAPSEAMVTTNEPWSELILPSPGVDPTGENGPTPPSFTGQTALTYLRDYALLAWTPPEGDSPEPTETSPVPFAVSPLMTNALRPGGGGGSNSATFPRRGERPAYLSEPMDAATAYTPPMTSPRTTEPPLRSVASWRGLPRLSPSSADAMIRRPSTAGLRRVGRANFTLLHLTQGRCTVYFYNLKPERQQHITRLLAGLHTRQVDRRRLLSAFTLSKLGLGYMAAAEPDRIFGDVPAVVRPAHLLRGDPKPLSANAFSTTALALINDALPTPLPSRRVRPPQLSPDLLDVDNVARWRPPADLCCDYTAPLAPYYPVDALLRNGGRYVATVYADYLASERVRRERNLFSRAARLHARTTGPDGTTTPAAPLAITEDCGGVFVLGPSAHRCQAFNQITGELVVRPPTEGTTIHRSTESLGQLFGVLTRDVSERLLKDYVGYMEALGLRCLFTHERQHPRRTRTGLQLRTELWRYLQKPLMGYALGMTLNVSLTFAATVAIDPRAAVVTDGDGSSNDDSPSDGDTADGTVAGTARGPRTETERQATRQIVDLEFSKLKNMLHVRSFVLDWQLRVLQQLIFGDEASVRELFPTYDPDHGPFTLDVLSCLRRLCADGADGIKFAAHAPLHDAVPIDPSTQRATLKYLFDHAEKYGAVRARSSGDTPVCCFDTTHPRLRFDPIRYQNKSLYITTVVFYLPESMTTTTTAHTEDPDAKEGPIEPIPYYAIVRVYDTEADRRRHLHSVQRRVIERQQPQFVRFHDWYERAKRWEADMTRSAPVLELGSRERDEVRALVSRRFRDHLKDAGLSKSLHDVWRNLAVPATRPIGPSGTNRHSRNSSAGSGGGIIGTSRSTVAGTSGVPHALTFPNQSPTDICPLDFFTHVCLDDVHPEVHRMLRLPLNPDGILTFLRGRYPRYRVVVNPGETRLLLLNPDHSDYLIQVLRRPRRPLEMCAIAGVSRHTLRPAELPFVRHVLETVATYLWAECVSSLSV